jgi:anaerobic dimethyl sulfoxide reductase subunit A
MGTDIAFKAAGQEVVIPTLCASHCGGSCLLKVHVKDGVITRIETDDGEEPQLRGCFRGRAYRQRVYDPDRILYPLKRVGERGEGKFQRISWDEATTTIANEIKRIRDTYGPSAIMYMAMAGDVVSLHGQHLYERLFNMAGGYTTVYGITSFGQGIFSQIATYGTVYTSNTRDDLLNAKLIILWGFDPAKCINGPNTAWYLSRAKEQGTRIISIDPRLGDTPGCVADQWIPIRPSTDAAMLIAMAYVMIVENLHDQGFIDKYTIGFDKYKDYVLGKEDGVPKTPAWAEDITGVPAETIAALAREYASTKPAAFLAGISPGRTRCGEMYHRAAAVLAAMTGNIGIHGGDAAGRAWESIYGGLPYAFKPTLELTFMPRVPGNPVYKPYPVTKSRLPAFRGPRIFWAKAADAIIKGKAGGYPADIKLLFPANNNYLNCTPNINRTVEAMKKLEFIATPEQVMTPTAKFCDIVLPVCTYMERNDITVVAQTFFGWGYQNKMIEPLGESKSHLDICMALAEKLGLSGYNDKTEDELLRDIAQRAGIPDYEKFKKEGIYRVPMTEPYVAFKKQIEDPQNNPFPTPSGKIEIYSSVMAEWENPELPPIPKWVEPFEILSDPLAKKYPLQLTTSHGKRRALGQYEKVPWLREVEPQTVWINPADAKARGIRDGDPVRVFNDRGVLVLPAQVTRKIMPGVVQVESGAWYDPDENGVDRGGNSNVLTRDDPSIGGSFCYNTCLVEVHKVEKC